MNFPLLFHNILFLFGALISIGVGTFVILVTKRTRNVTTLTFALSSFAVAVFQISHLLGINAPNGFVSRTFLMFNLTDIFIGIFMTHWFLGLAGKIKEQKKVLISVYASGIAMFIFFLVFPRTFLVESIPKLYFPFYYEPGPLYAMMVGWFVVVSIYHFYQLIKAYLAEKEPVNKNRLKYILLAMLYAYAFGTTAFLLVFDFPLNPALSALFGLYPLLIVYAILQYEVFDIRIFAKKAFVYMATILGIGFIITTTDFLSSYFKTIQPAIPKGSIPAVVSLLLGVIGIYAWQKARESDIAKYEFITVVTHKFRTPLTRIKWAAEEISKLLPEDKREMTSIITQSERQLLELTNTLIRLSESDDVNYVYKPESVNITEIIDQVKTEYIDPMNEKEISFIVENSDTNYVFINKEQIKFILQILVNNALSYTPKGGSVTVKKLISPKDHTCTIEVIDTGIGMSKDTAKSIFSRFYRGDKARLADTEGMGIGLFIARNILSKQNSSIVAHSEGEDKGSTFSLILPLDKSAS